MKDARATLRTYEGGSTHSSKKPSSDLLQFPLLCQEYQNSKLSMANIDSVKSIFHIVGLRNFSQFIFSPLFINKQGKAPL